MDRRGPTSIEEISEWAGNAGNEYWFAYRKLLLAFSALDLTRQANKELAASGDLRAQGVLQMLVDWREDVVPYKVIDVEEYRRLNAVLKQSPKAIPFGAPGFTAYPYHIPGRTYGYDLDWVRDTLSASAHRFSAFRKTRTSDVAVLVGNGPSLNKTDLSLLSGHDVYISNYAVKHPVLNEIARGVAVTNYLVAEQEPWLFALESRKWKFFPFWLRNTLHPDDSTIMLNARGGDLFFSEDVTEAVAWHSTVSFFWLQILYSAGYRKVLLIGFDNSYSQQPSAREGDLITQKEDDPNHFDPGYFRGKRWQAADTESMERTYALSKAVYEADGRELVNCTVGGRLEVLRRSSLEAELGPRKPKPLFIPPPVASAWDSSPRIAVVTPFWKGDVEQAELHWRLINRLGRPRYEHVHLFKHREDMLPPMTVPRVICADIEGEYPESADLPHPAGPNLTFLAALKTLGEQGYTHFFWLEPDCIPTAPDWLEPFAEGAREFPDEPIVGTGGGTVVPDKPHWKHHFAGCSLYNIEKLSTLDWDHFVDNQLEVSFDIWLSERLGYISIGEIDDDDVSGTIIYGRHRRKWELLKQPRAVVTGMFEHWRPEKFMSKQQLLDRVQQGGFKLYHAVKDQKILRSVYANAKPSVSTIIINYNNEAYLREAIDSALAQEGLADRSYEVIVVDDGSSDGSIEIIRSYGDRITPLYLDHGILNGNFNQQRALKSALRIAEGDIIFLLDGDDVFHADKISSVAPKFDDPDVVLVQHSLLRVDEAGDETDKPAAFFDPNVNVALYRKKERANFFQPTSGLAFQRAYLNHALRWLTVDRFENTWLDVRLTRLAPLFGKVVSLRSPLGAWRRHAASDSIRRDNLKERVEQHHAWLNHEGGRYGLHVDYGGVMRKRTYSRSDHARTEETGVVAELLKDRTGRDHVMIDVGAHFGSSAARFDRLGWTIHCFEPDPANRARLVERLGDRENVTIDPRAVSDAPAKGVPFFKSEESTGISGLHSFRDSHREEGLVDLTTVAEIVDDRGLSRVDFLKIDVEGFDLNVLRGVPWDRLRPDVIECEYEDAKTLKMGHNWRDIAEYLRERGYAVYISEWHPIIRYGITHDWRRVVPYPGVDVPSESWGNMLAFRDDPGYPAVVRAFEKLTKTHPETAAAAPPARPAPTVPAQPPAKDDTAPADRPPRGSRAAKWTKLRRDPRRFFGDAHFAPFRPLKYLFRPAGRPVPAPPGSSAAKWAKLRRDPRRYFADARFAPARPLRYLFPRAKRTKREVEAARRARAEAGGRLAFLPASRRALAAERAASRVAIGRARSALNSALADHRREARNRDAIRQAELLSLRTAQQALRDEAGKNAADLESRLRALIVDGDAALRSEVDELHRNEQAGRVALAEQLDAQKEALDALRRSEQEARDAFARQAATMQERLDELAQTLKADLEAVRLGLEQRITAEVDERLEPLRNEFESRLGDAAAQSAEKHASLRDDLRASHDELTQAMARIAQETDAALREATGSEIARTGEELNQRLATEIAAIGERIEAAQAAAKASQEEASEHARSIGLLRERVATGERQIGRLRHPDAPNTLVFFGHHKCASRFFRNEVFGMAAEATGARIRRYQIPNPPFHYSASDDLDLCNMDLKGLGEDGRDVVLFSNATERSFEKIKRATEDWKALRIIRDPRQVLVSDYFHHKGDHNTEFNGWIWDQLTRDKPILRDLPKEEGLLYELDNISKQIIEDQILFPFPDERVLTIKIEDFSQNPREHLERISDFLGIADIAGIDFSRTGANAESGPWQNHFTSRLREVFKERYGQALIDLGYAEDLDW